MKQLLTIFSVWITVFFTQFAQAGVGGYNDDTYKGVFSAVSCSLGALCSKDANKLVIKSDAVKTAVTLTSGDTTPSVASGNYFLSYSNNTVTVTDFDDGYTGQEIIVVSQGAVTYDVTSSGIKCGSTDLVTSASGDITRFVYDGTDWRCTARIKANANLN